MFERADVAPVNKRRIEQRPDLRGVVVERGWVAGQGVLVALALWRLGGASFCQRGAGLYDDGRRLATVAGMVVVNAPIGVCHGVKGGHEVVVAIDGADGEFSVGVALVTASPKAKAGIQNARAVLLFTDADVHAGFCAEDFPRYRCVRHWSHPP